MFRNAGYYFIALFALVLIAFAKTYGTSPTSFDPYTHVHAVLMVGWFGILIAQPFLIRREHRATHRLLGRISYVLVPLLAISILLLTHARISTVAAAALAGEAHFFYLPFGMTIAFLAAWLLGVRHRHTVALHARYMIATSLATIDPVLGRILAFYFPPLPYRDLYTLLSYAVTGGVLVLLIVRERRQRVGRAAFPIMLLVFTLVYAGFFTLAKTDAWLAFIRWFGSRALT